MSILYTRILENLKSTTDTNKIQGNNNHEITSLIRTKNDLRITIHIDTRSGKTVSRRVRRLDV